VDHEGALKRLTQDRARWDRLLITRSLAALERAEQLAAAQGASLEPYALWYSNKNVWAEALPFVSTTVHLTFPARIGVLLHHIMEHTAHHVPMSVPLDHLRTAQKLLEEKLPGAIIIQRFSWRWYFRTARRCKLYDFAALRWTDFKGRAVVA
jgi:fatty acid desaturase